MGRYGQKFSADRERDMLAWAATIPDETILGWRNTGPAILRWIRDHQRDPHEQVRYDDTTFAMVLKQTGWRVELFWNNAGGWFTARLISPWDRDGMATYPGGFLVPFDNPIGASGGSPEESLVNLSDAVLEWA
jgi:hypothetical protein